MMIGVGVVCQINCSINLNGLLSTTVARLLIYRTQAMCFDRSFRRIMIINKG